MYLTAQHVRSDAGAEDLQVYLHLHDVPGGEPFPPNPLSVPQEHPGVMVVSETKLPPGGNGVLAYVDVVAPDAAWRDAIPPWSQSSTAWWSERLGPLGELMVGRELPWVIEVGDVHVIFNAMPTLALGQEYESLVDVALGVWERWRSAHNWR